MVNSFDNRQEQGCASYPVNTKGVHCSVVNCCPVSLMKACAPADGTEPQLYIDIEPDTVPEQEHADCLGRSESII